MNLDTYLPQGVPLAALPSWSAPRLVIRSLSPEQRWHDSAVFPATRRIAKLARMAYRSRATVAPVQRTIEAQAPALDWCLSDRPLEFVIGRVGRMGRSRKVAIMLQDPEGAVFWAKCALTPEARDLIVREEHMLRSLPPGGHPTVVTTSIRSDRPYVVMTSADGKECPPTPLPDSGAVGALHSLYHVVDLLPINAHPWFRSLLARSDAQTARLAEDGLKGRDWPVVPCHGDFAPWNVMCDAESGVSTLIDWEHGEISGLPFLDEAHWIVQVSALVLRDSPSRALDRSVDYLVRQPVRGQVDLSVVEARALTALAVRIAYDHALRDGASANDAIQEWRLRLWTQIAGTSY